jgi:adenylate cyclase
MTLSCGRCRSSARGCLRARLGVRLLERALTFEPDYGLAHGYLAWCFEVLFARDGLDPEMAAAAARHAHAAITHARDDATALGLAGFVISLVEHDRRTAIEAFEAALRLSPSCSIVLILGAIVMGWANEAERALEWGERAVRLSPFDPLIYSRAHWACSWTFLRRNAIQKL